MTAFLVTTFLIAAGIVMVVGIMPWTQDNISKDALDAVRASEQTVKSTTRSFLAKDDMIAKKAMAPDDSIDVAVDAGGNCFLAVAKSESGKVFYVTNTRTEANELPSSGDTGCLTTTASKALADGVGGADDKAPAAAFGITYPDAVFSSAATAAETIYPTISAASGTLSYSYSGTLPDGVTFGTTTGRFYGSVWGNGAEAVTAGTSYGCGISNKTGYCWGSNTSGKLGNGSATSSTVPVAVGGLLAGKPMTAMSSGEGFTCGISNGAAYCWGINTYGQLGNGTTTSSTLPVRVDAAGELKGKTVTSISAGQNTACAVANGAAYCWGIGLSGIRGDGATAGNATRPVAVTATGVLKDKTVTAVSVAYNHACAIASGRAYCWGLNSVGQLGDGTTTSSSVPVAVKTASGLLLGKTVTDISAGSDGTGGATCAVASGRAYCWGANNYGQLGNNSTVASSSPVAVSTAAGTALAGLTVNSISTGYFHTCVSAGTSTGAPHAYCWGAGASGRLGNGGTADSAVPVSAGLDDQNVTAVAAGRYTSCAVASGGAYCWGGNGVDGALGNGATSDSTTPVGVKGLGGNAGFPADIQVTVTNGANSDSAQVKLELR
jgi:alpha-tubulin suppressor-like RCC1 family protein